MSFEITEIKDIRKKLGLTQTQLAKKANVSQSLIAKIESNRIDPTYSNVMKIFNALNELVNNKDIKAEEVMQKNLIYVDPDSSLKECVAKMNKYGISQLPVIKGKNVSGYVSEGLLLEKLINAKEKDLAVKEVMYDVPPVVSRNSSLSMASHLLKYFPMVLVSDNGNIKGIITKADVIRKLYK